MKSLRINGVSISTMQDRLEKIIFFELSKLNNLNYCTKCKQLIKNSEIISIDHIDKWISETSNESFLKLTNENNLGFAHKHCNIPENSFGTNQTGYIGVHPHDYKWKSRKTGEVKTDVNYSAKACFKGKAIYFKYWKDPYHAALARDFGVMKLYNGECRLNFEEKREFYIKKIQENPSDLEWIRYEKK